MVDIYDESKRKAAAVFDEHGLMGETVHVKARALSTTEAIGNPESDDYMIQRGKERLMQAEIRGALGQAFTDHFGDYGGTLADILNAPLTNNYRRAIFVAALNAALRHLGLVEGTIHCRDKAPRACADALAEHLCKRYDEVKITHIGLQPRMIESLAPRFTMRVLDMDPDNIGQREHGVVVESPEATDVAMAWADLLMVTGTTLVNRTLPDFLIDKPVVFYGTTIAGAAYLMGWERFCDKST